MDGLKHRLIKEGNESVTNCNQLKLKSSDAIEVYEEIVQLKMKWCFSIVDVVGMLTKSENPSANWRKLKERLSDERNETVTDCHSLKMLATDGKMQLTKWFSMLFSAMDDKSVARRYRTTEIEMSDLEKLQPCKAG